MKVAPVVRENSRGSRQSRTLPVQEGLPGKPLSGSGDPIPYLNRGFVVTVYRILGWKFMVKYCTSCGKAITDDITTVCSNCGAELPKPVSVIPKPITASRQEIIERAIPFFAAKKYAVRAQTDSFVSFESQDRDVDWLIFVVFCCLGLIPAIVYYYWFTHNHQVTLSLSGVPDVSMNVIGNTAQAKKDADEFRQLI